MRLEKRADVKGGCLTPAVMDWCQRAFEMKRGRLFVMTSLLSLLTALVATSTNNWIIITEPIPTKDLQDENGTALFPPEFAEKMVPVMKANAGLWKICYGSELHMKENDTLTLLEELPPTCRVVTFSQTSKANQDGADTINAIFRGTRRAAIVMVMTVGVMVVGITTGVIGNIYENMWSVAGAVLCACTGLCELLVVLLYMLAVNDQVGHRPKHLATPNGPNFDYSYSWSLALVLLSEVSINAAVVSCVYGYQARLQDKPIDDPEDMLLDGTALKKLMYMIDKSLKNRTETLPTSETIQLCPVSSV